MTALRCDRHLTVRRSRICTSFLKNQLRARTPPHRHPQVLLAASSLWFVIAFALWFASVRMRRAFVWGRTWRWRCQRPLFPLHLTLRGAWAPDLGCLGLDSSRPGRANSGLARTGGRLAARILIHGKSPRHHTLAGAKSRQRQPRAERVVLGPGGTPTADFLV